MNHKEREDNVIALTLLALTLLAGLLIGWTARVWTTADKHVRAEAEKMIQQSAYYEANTEKMKRDFLAGRGK